MNANDLTAILSAHKTWFLGEPGGKRADLRGAILRYADLHGANLHGADLRGADLRYADLHGANLHGADLRYANLHGADLRYADLHGANLHVANLHVANLHGADLHGASLHGADLRGADLRGAMNWVQSHDVIAELLRREARSDWEKRALAGLILMSRGLCWNDFLDIPHPQREWALSYLASLGCEEAKGGIS